MRRAPTIAFLALPAAWLAATAPGALAALPGDNGRIAFTRVTQLDTTTFSHTVDVIRPDGGNERTAIERAREPAWSPDGRRVAFTALDREGRGRGIALARADGSDRRMVTTDPDDGAPAWSRGGRRLVFHRFRSPGPGSIAPTIQVVRVDGSRRHKIADGAFPAWSADGRIAFVRRVSTVAPFFDGIHVIRPDGSGRRRVTSAPADNAPDWSPDGRRLVFTHGDRVRSVRPDGTHMRQVARSGAVPAWSPDGERIVFTQGQSLRTVRGDGSGNRVLTRHDDSELGPADWRPVPPGSHGATARVKVFLGREPTGTRCDRTVARTRTVWSPAVLRGALDALLWGPSASERDAGAGGWFSSSTAGMVRSVSVSGGVAHVDFRDLRKVIPNASTSCGSALLLAQLDRTAGQFPTVDRAVYSFNGSRRAFSDWLQLGG